MTEQQQSRRAQCPVCAHSVRVQDGKLVEHKRRWFVPADVRAWLETGATPTCPGSGQAPA